LIADWRARWGEGYFPFYFVQLANYKETKRDHQESVWSLLREAQRQALAKSPNTGMAVAIDLGDAITIHPKNKQDVGKRLALLARGKTYGEKGVVSDSPLYRSHVIEGSTIRVKLDTGGAPLMVGEKQGLNPVREVVGSKLQWFEIAGQDGTFVWAEAVIDGDCVVVSSPKIPSPVEVRYAWAENPAGCNLYNRAGLPASPFRTSSPSKRPAEEPRPGKDSNSEKPGRMNALPKAP
jgi:sialate O-acetylesterase